MYEKMDNMNANVNYFCFGNGCDRLLMMLLAMVVPDSALGNGRARLLVMVVPDSALGDGRARLLVMVVPDLRRPAGNVICWKCDVDWKCFA